MRVGMSCLFFVCFAVPASGQQIYGKPYGYQDVEWKFTAPPSEARSASVGSEMVRREQFGIARVTRYDGRKRLNFEGGASIASGGFLAVTNLKGGLVGCKYDYGVKACLVDQDRDGVFEAGGAFTNAGVRLVPLEVPAPYSPPKEEEVIDPAGTLTVALVYLGEAAGVLRFAHREYKADLARPAFTEELSFPKPSKFPAELVIKDLIIDVQDVSNAGIRYSIRPAVTTP